MRRFQNKKGGSHNTNVLADAATVASVNTSVTLHQS
jgi:hypothetical protein